MGEFTVGRGGFSGQFQAALCEEACQFQEAEGCASAGGNLGEEPGDEVTGAGRIQSEDLGAERDVVNAEEGGKPCRIDRSPHVLE